MAQEADRYGLALSTPVEMYLAPQIYRTAAASALRRQRAAGDALEPADALLGLGAMRSSTAPSRMCACSSSITIPACATQLAHSLGLQKGLIGVVNAFASSSQAAENNVVIAHELLHTVGATDKYDPQHQ